MPSRVVALEAGTQARLYENNPTESAALREAWVDIVLRSQTFVTILPRQTATIGADDRAAASVDIRAIECD